MIFTFILLIGNIYFKSTCRKSQRGENTFVRSSNKITSPFCFLLALSGSQYVSKERKVQKLSSFMLYPPDFIKNGPRSKKSKKQKERCLWFTYDL